MQQIFHLNLVFKCLYRKTSKQFGKNIIVQQIIELLFCAPIMITEVNIGYCNCKDFSCSLLTIGQCYSSFFSYKTGCAFQIICLTPPTSQPSLLHILPPLPLHPSLSLFISPSQGGLDLLVPGQGNSFPPEGKTIGSFLSPPPRSFSSPSLRLRRVSLFFLWDRTEAV